MNPHFQSGDRLAHRLAKVIQFPPVRPPLQGFTYLGTGKPKFDVIGFIAHRILGLCESGAHRRRIEEDVP